MAVRKYDMELIRFEAQKELARREFFSYCQVMAPDFYKDDRDYQKVLCDEMEDFYRSDDDVLIINMPPRFGKSRTATLFVPWIFGRDPSAKIMTASYNSTLSTSFSKSVRNQIMEIKADRDRVVYSDLFPDIKIKRGDAAMNLWSLEGQHQNYLATSPDATFTGFGANILIIDDLIRSALEANNEMKLEGHWNWFTDSMLSRLEDGGKIIAIMTRWASEDLAGRLLDYCKEEGWSYRHISMKALQDDGTMLCEDVLSHESYVKKTKAMSPEIASANYQQIPIDIQGRLYKSFKTYEKVPQNTEGYPLFEGVYSYTDTADTGDDHLVNIIFGYYNKEAYILDVIYTKEGMEVTEEMVAKAYHEFEVNEAQIEANHGATAFPRAVGKILDQKYKSNKTYIKYFYQKRNKIARIISNASWIMNHIYFPVNWRDKWPEYHDAMIKYQKEGKNAHDDAPDATTGVAEMCYALGA